jgi:glutamine synthetase
MRRISYFIERRSKILETVKKHNVKFIRLWFTDILGFLKSFAITVEELETALEEGMGFDGSSIEGFARIDESDMIAMPDPSTFQLLPWRPREHNAVARMFCDVLEPDGTPYKGDPRRVLKEMLKKASDMGYTFYVGPVFRPDTFRRGIGLPQRDGTHAGGNGNRNRIQPSRGGAESA